MTTPRKGPLQNSNRVSRRLLLRLVPLAILLAAMATYYVSGLYREVSLEAIIRHRAAIDEFVSDRRMAALTIFVAAYVGLVALSVPGSIVANLVSGVLFGALVGGMVTIFSATLGASLVFVIARNAFGNHSARRAVPYVANFAEGFRENSFSYILFLRLALAFPFGLVNLVAAFCDVRLGVFMAATAIGILPGSFCIAFVGAGLDSVLSAQHAIYKSCVSMGQTDCVIKFDVNSVLTSKMLMALAALSVFALVPLIARRLKARPTV